METKKDIKIIAFDLDDTLLDSNKEISEQNMAALTRAAEKGIYVVPTTGRFFAAVPQKIKDLPFLRYCITINGAVVEDLSEGKSVYSAEIPLDEALEIMRELDSYPLLYDCYVGNGGYLSERYLADIDTRISQPYFRNLMRTLRKPVPELKDFVKQLGQGIQKIQLFTNDKPLRARLLAELADRYENITVTTALVDNVEINASGANKGGALLALAEHLGFTAENTMAIGDGLNDLSMIKAAGVGVAMANANELVKQSADYVTLSCDESGVAAAIERFCF